MGIVQYEHPASWVIVDLAHRTRAALIANDTCLVGELYRCGETIRAQYPEAASEVAFIFNIEVA